MDRFDAVVIGMGPGGEVAATRLVEQGLRIAVCERELIGGECGYWACIPSKTLLRSVEAQAAAARTPGVAEPALDWAAVAAQRDSMIRGLDDARQVEGYESQGVTVVKGAARIDGPGRVVVGERELLTDRIVIATGSQPRIPPIDGLERAGYWTNREATTVSRLPGSVVIVGGGPVGIELAQLFARLGVATTLVQSHDRLVPREQPGLSERALALLGDDGVELRLGAQAQHVERGGDGQCRVTLDDGSQATGEQLIVATGRHPHVDGLGLETLGIEPDQRGLAVDDRCRVGDGVWAVGDVTGVAPFTHVGLYQGRIAAADIAGRSPRADYRAIPRVIFSDPELAAVGLTAAGADEQGIAAATAQVELTEQLARPWTYERDPRGTLGVVADREQRVLVGAWAVAPLAGEWIHYAALAIRARVPLDVLSDTVAQFPTYSEGWLKAVEQLDL